MITVTTIQEAAQTLAVQLENKDAHPKNYKLLNNIEDYLDKCEDKNLLGFDKTEQIYTYLTHDLQWEDKFSELFPMQL